MNLYEQTNKCLLHFMEKRENSYSRNDTEICKTQKITQYNTTEKGQAGQ